MSITIEMIVSSVFTVSSLVLTVWIFHARTQKTMQNGINTRLGSLEQKTTEMATDLTWIKEKMKTLPCVENPEAYFGKCKK